MRFSIFILLLFFLALTTPAQHILVIGEGEPWSAPEEMEILRYYGKTVDEFSWMSRKNTNWGNTDLEKFDIIWIHRADSIRGTRSFDPSFHAPLLNYVENGGSILLTQHALDFLNESGLEPIPVEHRIKKSEDNGYGRMLGFHAFLQHPVFDSLHGGAYIWKPPHDTIVSQCGFFGDIVPEKGKVVAVDWDYIFVREDAKLIVEYEPGKGKVLGIGAYFNLFEPNLNRMHYDVFYRNVFDYLTGKKDGETHYWLYADYMIEPIEHVLMRAFIPPEPERWTMRENPIALGREKAKEEYCEVAGRRILLAAYEPGGIFELWAHPIMAFRDYRASLRFGNEAPRLLREILPSIELSPESVSRIYKFENGAILKEVMVVSPDRPHGVIHYEYDGIPATFEISYKSNMRIMWPYSEKVLKTLKYAYQPGMNAIEFYAPEAELVTFLGANKRPLKHEIYRTSDTLFEIGAMMQFSLGSKDQMDIIFAAGSEGRDSVAEAYMDALLDPEQVYRDAVKHYEDLFKNSLMISTPDENFNIGYRWALAATDRFFVTTPGLGTSIVAGYNGTDRGWDGGHAVNGRPGYAWYFGRDAVWSAFAILDYGDYEGVKQILDMFVKFQDLNGKIYHELSTSGFVHYDAADATPLFIILAGRYLDYSGDTAYIESIWPAIKKAYQYCLSTDTDGNGLIENTNVGHGWVEGGHLFGSHTSLYLAACWGSALREIGGIMAALMHPDFEHYLDKSNDVFEKIHTDFYDKQSENYFQGLMADGSYHPEPSIMPSVLMYLDGQKGQYTQIMQDYSGEGYTTDWGIRMTSKYSKHYNPRGYHSGAVWPLYTGWVALAEYNDQRHLQGFSHIMSNLNIYRDFALGYTEEVLNGDQYLPSGVCPHQCWSETMVLLPIISGMLGMDIDAFSKKLTIQPYIPFEWDNVDIKNIRFGNHILNWQVKAEKDRTSVRISALPDKPDIHYIPLLMPGTEVDSILIDGKKTIFKTTEEKQGVGVWIEPDSLFNGSAEIIIYHKGGISLIPPAPKAVPGEPSTGLRIIDAKWEDNTYTIEVEGAAAQSYELELINNFGSPRSIEGVEDWREDEDRLFLTVNFPELNRRYTPKTVKVIF
ncbi:MAG: GH116 family glycosyl hydrolase [Bacteroidales bacterium]|jgi:hypothetical protein|nr:GH116 family glycosyl hydrolase [Bacteroidales bacterium]